MDIDAIKGRVIPMLIGAFVMLLLAFYLARKFDALRFIVYDFGIMQFACISMLAGGFVGFFIEEVLGVIFSFIIIGGVVAFVGKNYTPGDSYSITIFNKSMRSLDIRIKNPVVCGGWKNNATDIQETIRPGKSTLIFKGCKFSSFEYATNGGENIHQFSDGENSCYHLKSNLNLEFGDYDWSPQSVYDAFGVGGENDGALKKCY